MIRKFWTILCALALLLTPVFHVRAGAEDAPAPSDQALPLVTEGEGAQPDEGELPPEGGEEAVPAPGEDAPGGEEAVPPQPPEPIVEPGPVALVGLIYGESALAGANLANGEGSGFRFGYLDEDRAFWQLGYTSETAISVVKTQNVWYGLDPKYSDSLKCYSDGISSDVGVGCWHVQLPTEAAPASFEDAEALAGSLGGFPAWIEGGWQVRLGAYTTREEAQAAADLAGGTVVGTSAYGVSVVKTGSETILFQLDGGERLSLTVRPGLDESVKTVTHFKGRRYYGMFQFRRVGGGNLTVINALGLDDYTNCVITQEMSSSWPVEALKAQAVCARTYWETHKNKHGDSGFDLCSTTDCQAYPGMGAVNERTTQAIQETSNLRIWYKGKPIDAVYFSCDGGATEDVKNVWGGSLDYLQGVEDPFEETVSEKISHWRWTKTFTSAELTRKLQGDGYNCAAITEIRTELTPTGNVKTLILVDANGTTWPFTREKGVRNYLGFSSIRYKVSPTGESSAGMYFVSGDGQLSSVSGAYAISGKGSVGAVSKGNPYVITSSGTQFLPAPTGGSSGELSFTFEGSGWGHNVGMSQWGAYAMAQQGYTYDQILKFYYTGVEIY